ncbi:MAG: peptidoglycan-binding domain-containing protein, partial [Patescibacteria group bacterium]
QPSTIISKPTANTGWSFLPVCSDLASMDKFCKSNGYGSGESSGVAYSGGACAKWIDSSWTSSSDTLYDAKCYNPSPPVAYSLGSSLTANALGALDNAKNSEKKSQTNLNITNTQTPSCAEFTVTLSKGMNNAEVKCLQKKLNEKGFKIVGVNAGEETTYFGYATLTALKKFQTSNGLTADGIFGPASRVVLVK